MQRPIAGRTPALGDTPGQILVELHEQGEEVPPEINLMQQ